MEDEFVGQVLSGAWDISDPKGDGTIAVANGRVKMSVPGGSTHNPAVPNQALEISRPPTGDNFTVTAKFDSVPTAGFSQQGFLVHEDDDNRLRLDVHRNPSTGLRAFVESDVEGNRNYLRNEGISSKGPIWQRVQRSGSTWTYSVSNDGMSFKTVHTFNRSMSVDRVSVFVGNYGHNPVDAPSFSASVDWVRIEDSGTPSSTPTTAPSSTTTVAPSSTTTVPSSGGSAPRTKAQAVDESRISGSHGRTYVYDGQTRVFRDTRLSILFVYSGADVTLDNVIVDGGIWIYQEPGSPSARIRINNSAFMEESRIQIGSSAPRYDVVYPLDMVVEDSLFHSSRGEKPEHMDALQSLGWPEGVVFNRVGFVIDGPYNETQTAALNWKGHNTQFNDAYAGYNYSPAAYYTIYEEGQNNVYRCLVAQPGMSGKVFYPTMGDPIMVGC